MSELVQRYWQRTAPTGSPAPEKPREALYQRIAWMYTQECGTFASISKALDCSKRTVAYALAAEGVPVRPCTEKVRPRKTPSAPAARPLVTHALGSGFYLNPGDCPRCGAPVALDAGPVDGLCRLCCLDLAKGWIQKSGELPAERVQAVRAELARLGYEVAA